LCDRGDTWRAGSLRPRLPPHSERWCRACNRRSTKGGGAQKCSRTASRRYGHNSV
jgi:hypothetical protein